MTEKRFRVQEHCLRSSYGIEAENWLVTNDNHSVVLNDKAEAHMVANMSNDVIDKLNLLHEEKNELRLQLNLCSDQRNEFHRGARENANRVGKLEEENKQLKQVNEMLQMDLAMTERNLIEENEQLKEELKELKIDNEAKDDAIDGLQEMMAHYNLEDLE